MVLDRPDRATPRTSSRYRAPVVGRGAALRRARSLDEIRRQRVLALMLGDTSMGMINGYFGPRLLDPASASPSTRSTRPGSSMRMQVDRATTRVDDAFRFVQDKGVTFHWRETDAEDFTEEATREQLRDVPGGARPARRVQGRLPRLAVPARPAAAAAAQRLLPRACSTRTCRPESNGDVVITSTEADQGNLVPMELMKRLLEGKGLHQAVMFHDVRWGGRARRAASSGCCSTRAVCGAYAFNHDPDTLQGVHSYRQPAGYFPIPGGTFAGESLPGHDHLGARLHQATTSCGWTSAGARSVQLPADGPRRLVGGHDPPVAVHGRRPRLLDGDGHGPLPEQPRRRRLRRHLRRDGRAPPRRSASACG